jgi:hypothetical protein
MDLDHLRKRWLEDAPVRTIASELTERIGRDVSEESVRSYAYRYRLPPRRNCNQTGMPRKHSPPKVKKTKTAKMPEQLTVQCERCGSWYLVPREDIGGRQIPCAEHRTRTAPEQRSTYLLKTDVARTHDLMD